MKMSRPTGSEITIPTFINPHLFWIFEKDSLQERSELESKLNGVPHMHVKSPQLEQEVLVKTTTYKRAIIKDIASPKKYYCWLQDYGIMHNTDQVYKAPSSLSKIPPLAKQASLDNVVCVEEVLGPLGKMLQETLRFTPGTIQRAKKHIDSAAAIFFKCTRQSREVYIGTVEIVSRCGECFDLSRALIQDKLLVYNTQMYESAFEINSNVDNENYLKFTRTSSPYCSSGADSTSRNDKSFDTSIKSVGRASLRHSNLETCLETNKNKEIDLEKWVSHAKATVAEVYDSDDDLKNIAKTDITVDSIAPSDSVSVSIKLSPSRLEKLHAIRNHLAKNLCVPKQDKNTDISTETESTSGSSFEATTQPSKSLVNSRVSVKSWGDYGDIVTPEQSVTRLLNIQPAGATYSSTDKPKKIPLPLKQPLGNSKELVPEKLPVQDQSINNSEKDVMDIMHNIDPDVVCICKQCKKWTTNTVVKQIEEKVRQPKKIVKPQLLFRSEDDNEEVVVRNFADEMKYRSKYNVEPNIVVHGTIFPKPVYSVTEVPFNVAIHESLQAFDQVYSIQSFMWPCLLRQLNVCVVNSPKTGKTMGYLPVICSNLLERQERYEELPTNTISPIVVVLCPGTQVADEVYDLTIKRLVDTDNLPAIALAVPPMDRPCLNQFQKQCDLLITTPVMFTKLLRSRIITAKRVCHLVLEHADLLLEKFPNQMATIFDLLNSTLANRTCNNSVQLISVSERWTPPLETLMKRLQYIPFICIGSHLEAALYGRTDIQIHFLESQVKNITLCDILKNNCETCRTVVVCNHDEQVNDLRDIFEMKGVKGVFVTSAMEKVEIEETQLKWLSTVGGKHLVFICTDHIYNTILRIGNAVILIHYNLPKTWTQFSNRFSCFIQNYESPLNSRQQDWIRCKTHVFLDESCTRQFPKLIQLLTRMGCKLTEKFEKFYEMSIKEREDNKISQKVPLCHKIKLFGKCTNLKCPLRHKLSYKLDYSNNLPKSGNIKFKILRKRNVTSFIVKLLEHTDLDGNIHNLVAYPNLKKDLQNALQNEKRSVFDAKLHGKYVFYSSTLGVYLRCVVKKIVSVERITQTATIVIAKFVDEGYDSKVGVADLYEMPEEFLKIPAQGIEVYLANLVPPDSDEHFSSYLKAKVHRLIDSVLEDGKAYCTGRVLLQLGNTIWVKDLLVMEDLATLKTTAIRLNLTKDLTETAVCEAQLQGLYKLCEEAAIELPMQKKKPINSPAVLQQATPQWAFLDEVEYAEVYLVTIETPSLFYVRIKKFYDLLVRLERDIQDRILKPFYPVCGEVKSGRFYLAKDPDGENYCRVEVTEVRKGIATCFYVDYGDYGQIATSEIKFLSNDLIQRLPFQAIECSLYGVQPVDDDWDMYSVEIMDRYIFEPETDFFRTLFAKACKSQKSISTNNSKYRILLIDTFRKNHTLINKLLLDCGAAQNISGENLDIKFEAPNVNKNEVEEEEEIANELTFKEVEQLQKKYGVVQNVPDNQESTDNVWDFEINNKELWLKHLLGVPEVLPSETKDEQLLQPIKALPSLGYSTPNIQWHQTETHIKLSINLPNIESYFLRLLRNASLIFKTFCNETEYQFHLPLFDKVEMGQESLGGLCLKITLVKCQASLWPRLTLKKERLHFLKYDLEQCVEPEAPKKPILSLGTVLEEGDAIPGDTIMQYGSDDSESDFSISSGDF